MLHSQFAVYLGAERPTGYTGFIVDEHHFVIVDVEEGFDQDQGHALVSRLKEKLHSHRIIDITHIDAILDAVMHEFNVPPGFSLAMGIQTGKAFYLKTIGNGQIYISRGQKFARIIEGDNSASGFAEDSDTFIFTTYRFMSLVDNDQYIKKLSEQNTPHQIVEEITPTLKALNDEGAIALFTCFSQSEESTDAHEKEISSIHDAKGNIVDEEQSGPEREYIVLKRKKPSLGEKLRAWKSQLSSDNTKKSKRKLVVGLIVAVVFAILIWSVVLGYNRRTNEDMRKKIQASSELINQKLNQADDVAFLNMPRALALISEAKDELNRVKKETGAQDSMLAALSQKIQLKEDQISKKEEKNGEEFYDLTLDQKNAKGNKMYLDGDSAAILDKDAGSVYILSLQKKSLTRIPASSAKKADAIGYYNSMVYLLSASDGIYKVGEDTKETKVLDADKNMSSVQGMFMYSGNIYVLDSNKQDVYKYSSTDSGFSGGTSYFKDSLGVGLSSASSLAIDSSVYISLDHSIVKYTGGLQDSFSTSFPSDKVSVTKLYTNKDLDKVYTWDKSKGSIFVIGKDGQYEKEVKSSLLKTADDFTVYDNAVYVLIKEKIYKISI